MPEQSVLQLGAVAILFLVGIREFFAYLKSKKDNTNGNNGNGYGLNKAILTELQTMNSNHLHTIQKCVEDGNRNLIETIHNDNTKMIELLGEIKGVLSSRR
jgi:hypothetical protein